MQSKQAEGASTSQAEASGRTGDPDLDASNSVTSVVTPLLEKTDNYLASWGLTTSASNPKSEDETAVQVSCAMCVYVCVCVCVCVSVRKVFLESAQYVIPLLCVQLHDQLLWKSLDRHHNLMPSCKRRS